VFELDEWVQKTGNTGPYLLYAYARTQAVLRRVREPTGVEPDWEALRFPQERAVLTALNGFWSLLTDVVVAQHNPAPLCTYLYDLCRHFSSWYEAAPFLHKETNLRTLSARLQFVRATGLVLKKGLELLGIPALDKM
jgi:arginyl-tRNA synthetase